MHAHAVAKTFVVLMLTRDLFAAANLHVATRSQDVVDLFDLSAEEYLKNESLVIPAINCVGHSLLKPERTETL